MCGIGGWFATASSRVDREAAPNAEKMLEALRHRGPDDRGEWRDPTGSATLLHTRLAIIDLSPAGHQPMATADGRFHITFNGEIYNYRELRRELESEGVSFTTSTDTEVILQLYARRGASSVQSLRGMYAFAIWDQQLHTAFLARGPFGIKPLYYWQDGSRLVFASELRALLASGVVPRKLDPDSVARYFETGSVSEPQALIVGVRSLAAGGTLHWKAGKAEERSTIRLTFPPPFRKETAAATAARLRTALQDSIQAHFVSDVPVGIFLSGGLDSTAILALARAANPSGDLRTFSIGVDTPDLNEAPLAELVARRFQTQHVTEALDTQAARDRFPRFLAAMDTPSIDGFNTWLVSDLAHRHGMKVVLSGLGGDELLGGYPSFSRVPRLHRIGTWVHRIPQLGALLAKSMELTCRSSRWRRLAEFLRHTPTLGRAYRAYRGVFPSSDARALARHFAGNDDPVRTSDRELHDLMPLSGAESPGEIVSLLEATEYMKCQLLRDSDVMSMAHGLELRVPFLDAELFEVLRAIPADLRLQPGKALLKAAVPELPTEVLNAPKRGFTMPYDRWLSLLSAERLDADLPVRPHDWYQRWSVFVFQNWMKRVFASE